MSGGPRRRRWARGTLDVVLALLFCLIASGAFELDRPWMKARVQAYLRSSVGLDLDYASARMTSLQGVEIDGLVIHGRVAAESLRAGHAHAWWSRASLFGDGPSLERVEVSDVTLTLVVDQQTPSSPLSHRPRQWLGSAPPARQLDATRVNLAVIWMDGHRLVETDALQGFDVTAVAEPSADGWRVQGRAHAPRELEVSRERPDASASARTSISLVADMTPSRLTIASDLGVIAQSFAPSVGTGAVHVEATAKFDPAAGRTTIMLDHVRAGSAATAEALIELPDDGDAILRHAEGDLDGARVLQWLPLVPFTADEAKIRYRIDGAVLASAPWLEAGGRASIEAQVANAKVRIADVALVVARARLAFEARPSALSGIAELDGTRGELSGMQLDTANLSLDVDGARDARGAITGQLAVRFGRLHEQSAGTTIDARDGHAQVRVAGNDATASARLATVEARRADVRVLASAVTLESRGRLVRHAPYAGDLELSTSSTQVFAADRIVNSPARIAVHLEDGYPDAGELLASRGAMHVSIDVDQGRAILDAFKGRDAIDYALVASPRGLPFPIALRSRGRLERIRSAEPTLRQQTSFEIEAPVIHGLTARAMAVTFTARGTLSHQEVLASVRAAGLSIAGGAPIDDEAVVAATIDRRPWSLRLDASVEGHVRGHLAGSASFDDEARAVSFDVDGLASNLAPAVGPLAGFDLSRTELGFKARGSLAGALDENPFRTAAFIGTVDLRGANLRWAARDMAIVMPAAAWHGEMGVEGNQRKLRGQAEIESVRVLVGPHEIDLAAISDDASITVAGDLRNPTIRVSQRGTIRAAEQDYLLDYPLGDLTTALTAERGRDGLLRVSSLNVHNARGGTALDVIGSIDSEGRQRRLAMTASVVQDLAPLSNRRFDARGAVKIMASVESPNLGVFRTHGRIAVEHARVKFPSAQIEAEGVEAEIPFREVFDVAHGVVTLDRKVAPSPFARLGLADRHPLLQRGGFVSVARLTAPHVVIAPLVGNLSFDQNVIALQHFEMGLRDGWLTGECVLDWDGRESKLATHVRASGVRSSHGEPFDGNIAIVIGSKDRRIEGRAEVVRMGGQHLRDLLDVADPLHTDDSMNAVRSALAWGYPKHVSAVFDNGFANAEIQLGGLAKFLSVPDLRGVPTGPLVDRLVEAALDGKATP